MVRFFSADIPQRTKSQRKIARWIHVVIGRHGAKPGEIQIILCSDAYLLAMNKQYLRHDYLTDIITFGTGEGTDVSGELYISRERVMENAREFGHPFQEELERVIVHGVLHLLGFEDKNPNQRANMRVEEDKMLLIRAL